MSTILAVDQSTSATKALLFDTEFGAGNGPAGGLRAKTARDHRQIYPQPGWVEHDAEEIYHNTLAVCRDLLEQHPAARDDLLCLSLTNQRETVVAFERGTGRPLHNAIVWQCRRGEPICAGLRDAGHSETVRHKTGLPIDTYFPASKLTWLFEHDPALRARVEAGEALVGTIDTYLVYRLTNGRLFATDHTNASRTLLYNIRELAWDDELCALFGVPPAALPLVQESSAQYATTDLDGLLAQPVPISGIMGDSQAALFAQRCYEPGMAKVTFGTGSSVLLNLGAQMIDSPNGIVTTIGWVRNGQPTYAFEGIINFTGATVAWLRDQLGLVSDAAHTEQMAEAVPDNGGVYLVPAFVGLSAPYWRADARGAIVGLTPAATCDHLARAALEAIAYRVRDVLGLMAHDAGMTLDVVHGDGGAVGNRFLMQFVADQTRHTIRASTLPELSALGATLAGALGMNVYADLAALAALPLGFDAYAPQMDATQADALYAGWQHAVRQVLAE